MCSAAAGAAGIAMRLVSRPGVRRDSDRLPRRGISRRNVADGDLGARCRTANAGGRLLALLFRRRALVRQVRVVVDAVEDVFYLVPVVEGNGVALEVDFRSLPECFSYRGDERRVFAGDRVVLGDESGREVQRERGQMAEELAPRVADRREELLGPGGNSDGREAREGTVEVAFELLGGEVRVSSILVLTPEAGAARALAAISSGSDSLGSCSP